MFISMAEITGSSDNCQAICVSDNLRYYKDLSLKIRIASLSIAPNKYRAASHLKMWSSCKNRVMLLPILQRPYYLLIPFSPQICVWRMRKCIVIIQVRCHDFGSQDQTSASLPPFLSPLSFALLSPSTLPTLPFLVSHPSYPYLLFSGGQGYNPKFLPLQALVGKVCHIFKRQITVSNTEIDPKSFNFEYKVCWPISDGS